MYDKVKNIKITNNEEPRMEFEVDRGNNNGTRLVEKYDVCLSLISMGNSNAQDIIESVLKEIYNSAKINFN